MTLSKEVERMTHTTAKEAAIHKVNMRMAQKHNYREMAEKGLSQEAKKYRDSYIKHKKEDSEDEEIQR